MILNELVTINPTEQKFSSHRANITGQLIRFKTAIKFRLNSFCSQIWKKRAEKIQPYEFLKQVLIHRVKKEVRTTCDIT